MKIRAKVVVCLVALIATVVQPISSLTPSALAQGSERLLITEFMADNDTVIADEDGDFEDWIEIHNPGQQAIDLGDWALTDDSDDLTQWRFPSQTLAAGDYLVVFASKKNRALPGSTLHTNFKLTSGGEYLALVEPDGQTISDEFSPAFPIQSSDVSYGRTGNFYDDPTPGAPNAEPAIAPVVFDPPGKAFVNSESVTLSAGPGRGNAIRYTTDGSEPTLGSPVFAGSLQLSETRTVRARVFDGVEAGAESESTYIKVTQDLANRTSNLPLVVVEAFGQTLSSSTVDVTIGVIDRNGNATRVTDPADYTGRTSIKWRGSSSLSLDKKQYKIELETQSGDNAPADLLGFGAEQDWILYAPGAFDRNYVANPLMQRLAGDVGLVAMDQQFVELYLNTGSQLSPNDYQGIYILSESVKIDTNRVDISKLDENDNQEPQITGGYVVSIDRPDDNEYSFNVPSNLFGDRDDFNVVSPKNDRLTSAQRGWINDWMDDLDQVLFGSNYRDVDSGYRNYIDTRSFIDAHALEMISMNPDSLRLSNYLHLDRGGKLRDGPIWDFDRALNSTDSRDDDPDRVVTPVPDSAGIDPTQWSWWGRLLDDERFRWEYAGRWAELRDGPLSNNAIFSAIDDLADDVRPAYGRENDRWGAGANYGSRYGDFNGEINALKDWLNVRLATLDNWVDDLPSGANQRPNVATPNNQVSWVGDPVQLQVVGSDPEFQTLRWSASGLPTGLGLDVDTGLITGITTSIQNLNVTVTATDSIGASRSQTFNWSVIAPPPAPIVLNEWNAVGASDLLPGGDPFFGQVPGNGGDWFELIVIEDQLDLRGWTLELSEDRGGLREVTDTLVFGNDAFLSNIRGGTIITISEDRADDISFDPGAGDWWINLRAADGGAGSYFSSQANFDTSADDWQLVIRDSSGTKQFGPAGEGVGSLLSGVTSTEVGELEEDPTAGANVSAQYDDGDDSTYGALNTFGGAAQNAGPLRAWFNRPPVIGSVADRTDLVGEQVLLNLSATDPDGDPITWSAASLPGGMSIDSATGRISGSPTDAQIVSVTVTASDSSGESSESFTWTINRVPVETQVLCEAASATLEVVLFNDTDAFATYFVSVDGSAMGRSISSRLTNVDVRTGLTDGPVQVTVTRGGQVIFDETVTIACGNAAPAPTPVPTPTAVPAPTATPVPSNGEAEDVAVVVTCLAENGRVDINIVNTGASAATYRVEFEGLSPRESTVAAGDWRRMPLTGRPDRDFDLIVKRDGVVAVDTTVTVACDGPEPQIEPTEVQVINACRGGNGYILFQFANAREEGRGWVIEFDGVPNRSTSAAPWGASVRAVTGRQDGIFEARIRVGSTRVATLSITVDCD